MEVNAFLVMLFIFIEWGVYRNMAIRPPLVINTSKLPKADPLANCCLAARIKSLVKLSLPGISKFWNGRQVNYITELQNGAVLAN